MESAQSFTGWVRHIFDADQYSREFVVANYDSDITKENMRAEKKTFPKALRIKANIKNGAANQIDSISEGDKVVVEFYQGGVEGISKSTGKYYAINELNLAKQNGITILEKATQENAEAKPEPDNDDDIPF